MSELGTATIEVTDAAQPKETDWKAEARKWEARAKENSEALASKTTEFDALSKDREGLSAKVAELEASIAETAAKQEFSEVLTSVSEASGVPAEALRGSTREELEAHAEALKALIKPSGPVVPAAGETPAARPTDPEREFVTSLFRDSE